MPSSLAIGCAPGGAEVDDRQAAVAERDVGRRSRLPQALVVGAAVAHRVAHGRRPGRSRCGRRCARRRRLSRTWGAHAGASDGTGPPPRTASRIAKVARMTAAMSATGQGWLPVRQLSTNASISAAWPLSRRPSRTSPRGRRGAAAIRGSRRARRLPPRPAPRCAPSATMGRRARCRRSVRSSRPRSARRRRHHVLARLRAAAGRDRAGETRRRAGQVARGVDEVAGLADDAPAAHLRVVRPMRAGQAPRVDAVGDDDRPAAPERLAQRCRSGAKRRLNPTISVPDASALACSTAASSSSSSASGFSTKTCLPARSASAAYAACVSWRVAIMTPSRSAARSTSSAVGRGDARVEALGGRAGRDAGGGRHRLDLGLPRQRRHEDAAGEGASPDNADPRPRAPRRRTHARAAPAVERQRPRPRRPGAPGSGGGCPARARRTRAARRPARRPRGRTCASSAARVAADRRHQPQHLLEVAALRPPHVAGAGSRCRPPRRSGRSGPARRIATPPVAPPWRTSGPAATRSPRRRRCTPRRARGRRRSPSEAASKSGCWPRSRATPSAPRPAGQASDLRLELGAHRWWRRSRRRGQAAPGAGRGRRRPPRARPPPEARARAGRPAPARPPRRRRRGPTPASRTPCRAIEATVA